MAKKVYEKIVNEDNPVKSPEDKKTIFKTFLRNMFDNNRMYQDFYKNFLLVTMESEKVHGEKWIIDYVEKMNEYTM